MKKKKILIAITAVAVSLLLAVQAFSSLAVYSDNDSAGKTVTRSNSQIGQSTLIIGTYLINLNGLTDQVYELAMDSAENFNQTELYYKSELAGGQWFNISSASSIADITTEGTPVDNSVIEALGFTHSVDENGVITDLRTGSTVSAYSIPDPYDLENLPELEPIKTQLTTLQAKTSKTDTDEDNIDIIRILFTQNTKDATTNDCDSKVTALEAYKNDVINRDKPSSWSEAIDTVTASVDATRRVVVYEKVADYLVEMLNLVNGSSAGSPYSDFELDSDYEISSDLTEAVATAQSNVQTALITYQAKLITEGTSVSGKAKYTYSNNMISAVSSSDYTSADTATQHLVNIGNITQSVIADSSSELNTLNSGLVDDSYAAYKTKLSAGVSADYTNAVASNATDGVKTNYLETQKTETDTARLEYQSYLSEMWNRSANAAAQADCLSRIDQIQSLRDMIVDDEVKSYLLETVEDHLVWLRQELANLIAASGDTSNLTNLKNEKEDLDNQRREALDNNNLSEASRLLAEMEAVQKDIDDETAKQTAILNSASSSDADKAKALASLTEGSTAKVIAEVKDNILSAIRTAGSKSDADVDSDTALNNMSALSSLATYDPDSAKAALGEIQDAITNSSSPDSDVVSELGDMANDLASDMDSLSDGLTDEQLASLLSDYVGADASLADKAGALIGLSLYAEAAPDKNARKYAVSLATSMYDEGNTYIYTKYNDSTETYVSLFALKDVKEFRYVYDQAHYTVTLTKAAKYYKFTSALATYTTSSDKSKAMTHAAALQTAGRTTLYIHSDDCSSIFNGITGYYVPDSTYASIRTPEMEDTIQEVYNLLMNGGEE